MVHIDTVMMIHDTLTNIEVWSYLYNWQRVNRCAGNTFVQNKQKIPKIHSWGSSGATELNIAPCIWGFRFHPVMFHFLYTQLVLNLSTIAVGCLLRSLLNKRKKSFHITIARLFQMFLIAYAAMIRSWVSTTPSHVTRTLMMFFTCKHVTVSSHYGMQMTYVSKHMTSICSSTAITIAFNHHAHIKVCVHHNSLTENMTRIGN